MKPNPFFSITLALQVPTESPSTIFSKIPAAKIFYAILVIAAVYLLIKLGETALEGLSRKAPRARFFFKLLSPLIRFTLWLGGAFVIATIFSPSPNTLLAVLASVGIALGLGAQDLVKNLVGGLVILADRPYQLGDLVQIGDALGEIDHIGLRSTKLTTFSDTRVTIPNSDILNGKAWCSNSGMPYCQVETYLYLPPDANPAEVQQICFAAACSSPYIFLGKPVVVLVQDKFDLRPHVRVNVKAYVHDHRYQPRFQSDITIRAKTEFLKRGMLLSWQTPSQVHAEVRPVASS